MKRRSFLELLAGMPAAFALSRPSADEPLIVVPERERVRAYSFIRRKPGKPLLRIYAGMAPSSAGQAITNQLMLSEAELAFSADRGGVHYSGQDSSMDNTGVASFARFIGPYGETIGQLPVVDPCSDPLGTSGGLRLESRQFVTGFALVHHGTITGVPLSAFVPEEA